MTGQQPHPTYTAQTMWGLEDVLAQELRQLGAEQVEVRNRAVQFTGDRACLYRANLYLRTAVRVLLPIQRFPVRDERDLYEGIKRMPWEEHLTPRHTLAVSCTLHSDRFNHSHYLALKAKDAIADRFRERTGERPSVDLDDPDFRIHLQVHGDSCLVSLDTSGGSLHRRGYRSSTNLAPLNEVLAAGLVLLSGWDRNSPFVDGMCGSGTIPIEAALYALDIPPGRYRQRFGFEAFRDHDRALWADIKADAERGIRKEGPMILAGELSANVARKAGINIARAGLKEHIQLRNRAFQTLEPPPGPGTLVLNPPYGERMDLEDIGALYEAIGDTLKKKWAGYQAWVLTSDREAANRIHLTPKPRIKLFNGSLECRFLRYEMYSGTKRTSASPSPDTLQPAPMARPLLSYTEQGSGPALLLIHGFPHDHTAWAPQLRDLAPHARVIAVDLRGPAVDDKDPAPITMEAHAQDLVQLLDHLGIDQAVVCGLSMGGYVALAFALEHPMRTAALVLCNTRAGADDEQGRAGREQTAQRALEQGTSVIARGMVAKMVTDQAPAGVREDILAMMERQRPATVATWARGMAVRRDQQPRLGSIQVPTLIITSDADEAISPAESATMHRMVPGSTFVNIPGAGHMSNLEAPAAFNAALTDFLARNRR